MPRRARTPKPRPQNPATDIPKIARPDEVVAPAKAVSKNTPLAEIFQFPEGKDVIPGAEDIQPDSETKTRWLKLAGEALANEEDDNPKSLRPGK